METETQAPTQLTAAQPSAETITETTPSLHLASTAIMQIRLTLTTELQVIPAAFRGLVVNLISAKIAPILNLDADQLDELDADADRLIDGIAERDVAIVGGLIKKYKVSSGGIVGRVIARLMGVKDDGID